MSSGVFLLRNSAWGRQFVKRVWDTRPRLGAQAIYDGEQAAIRQLLLDYPTWELHIHVLPQCSMNSHPQFFGYFSAFQRGDFIAHVAGETEKLEILQRILAAHG